IRINSCAVRIVSSGPQLTIRVVMTSRARMYCISLQSALAKARTRSLSEMMPTMRVPSSQTGIAPIACVNMRFATACRKSSGRQVTTCCREWARNSAIFMAMTIMPKKAAAKGPYLVAVFGINWACSLGVVSDGKNGTKLIAPTTRLSRWVSCPLLHEADIGVPVQRSKPERQIDQFQLVNLTRYNALSRPTRGAMRQCLICRNVLPLDLVKERPAKLGSYVRQ